MVVQLLRSDRRAAEVGACILTAAGGMMDGWVYLAHGHLFANAQTGNVVLLALSVAAGRLGDAAHFVPSIAAFVAGLFVSRLAATWLKSRRLNSRTIRLGAECVILLGLGLWAHSLSDTVVTASVGFIAALQITSLSHIGRSSFNTGMTTGNLTSAVSATVAAWLDGSAADRARAAALWSMCVAFLLGALLSGLCTHRFGDRTVFLIAALVACAVAVTWRAPDPLPEPGST